MKYGIKSKRKTDMRLDKYLKITKLIKRRPVGNLMCDEGKIKIDDRIGKASSSVKKGQVLEIDYGKKVLKVKILPGSGKTFPGTKTCRELYENNGRDRS